MLNVEKFVVLTANRRLDGVDGLVQLAATAAALVDLENDGVIDFVPADLTTPWDLSNPLIRVNQGKFPSSPSLNPMFKKIGKLHNKTVASALTSALDPRDGTLKHLAAHGRMTEDAELVGDETVSDRLGLVLRGQTNPTDSDRLLLGLVEAINATSILLGSQWPQKSPAQLSARIEEVPSTHPVLTALRKHTDSSAAMMKKSQLV